MGKDLKGKECGKGICQRKDGLYSARYTVDGKTRYSYFKTVKEAKAWLKEEKDTKRNQSNKSTTVNEWYSYILKAVTENLTFVVLKQAYDMPCERDMFYDRRRKFYWALSRVR